MARGSTKAATSRGSLATSLKPLPNTFVTITIPSRNRPHPKLRRRASSNEDRLHRLRRRRQDYYKACSSARAPGGLQQLTRTRNSRSYGEGAGHGRLGWDGAAGGG